MRLNRQDQQAQFWRLQRYSHRPIERYFLLRFASMPEGVTYCHDVVEFLQRPEGIEFTEGTDRAVLWVSPAGGAEYPCQVFASWGALCAAKRIGLEAQLAGELSAGELPVPRALVFGETSDREETPLDD
jgi:hypothetical protein